MHKAKEDKIIGTPELVGICVGVFLFISLIVIGVITYLRMKTSRSQIFHNRHEVSSDDVSQDNPSQNGSATVSMVSATESTHTLLTFIDITSIKLC